MWLAAFVAVSFIRCVQRSDVTRSSEWPSSLLTSASCTPRAKKIETAL